MIINYFYCFWWFLSLAFFFTNRLSLSSWLFLIDAMFVNSRVAYIDRGMVVTDLAQIRKRYENLCFFFRCERTCLARVHCLLRSFSCAWCVRACVWACVRACVPACKRICVWHALVHVRVRVCACMHALFINARVAYTNGHICAL